MDPRAATKTGLFLSPRSAAAVAATVLVLGTLLPAAAWTRDDVPPDVAARANPVTLEDDEVRYYKRQFKGKCARCHGIDGTGKGDSAGDQTVPPANFTDSAYMSKRSDGQLYYQILEGGGEACAMPAFGPGTDHSWTEDKIWHMVAYVRRFAATK
ncbi:MAG: cytochrome c [Deltaproteobacteria bacterium]|nr:cytochrome c [Deltaproteobacteria bacterium]MBW2419836.1 cytochrome c [Deltaproteobacteria bacterium]